MTTKITQAFLYFVFSRSFTTLWSALDDKKERSKKKKTPHPNERSDVAQKKQKGPASLLGREAEVSVGALKTKSCLSVSEFFLFSGEKCRSSPKSADGEFSLFRFFCSGKRNEMPLRHEQQRSVQAQRQLSEKTFFLQNFFFQEKEKAPSLRFSQIPHNRLHLRPEKHMPARVVAEGTKLLHQQRTSIDPSVKRFQRTLLSGMGIIEQSQFGLVVGTDFEHRMIHLMEVV